MKRSWFLILILGIFSIDMIVFVFIFFVVPFFLPINNKQEEVIEAINTIGLTTLTFSLVGIIIYLFSILRKPLNDKEHKFLKGILC